MKSYVKGVLLGFQLLVSSCTTLVITECSESEKRQCPEFSTCYRNSTEQDCRCHSGYEKDGMICQDIDECNDTSTCHQRCSNTLGAYVCSCETGFVLLEDLSTCKECDSSHFGTSCAFECTCNPDTSTCDKKTGECNYTEGWIGDTSSDDIDECNSNDCTSNSHCVNTEGGYSCICDAGYILAANGECDACGKFTYGIECQETCSCFTANSVGCDNVNGSCNCIEGISGLICEIDVDECDSHTDNCDEKQNTHCENTYGSFVCSCNDGFQVRNDQCEDVNECTLQNEPCQQECINTYGSYECACYIGFVLMADNATCNECTGNKYGMNCITACPCNETKSANMDQSCNSTTGECICNGNWTGTSCEIDVNECLDVHICDAVPNADCHNTFGGFQCACNRGLTVDQTGNCVRLPTSTTPAVPASGVKLEVEVTLAIDLENGTNLNVSTTYNAIAAKVIVTLTIYYQRYTLMKFTIIINDMRLGSLIVDHLVISEQKSTTIATDLTMAVADLGKGTEIQYDGQNVSATSDTFKNADICDVFLLSGACDAGYTCELENARPICRLKSVRDNYSLISMGLSVGGSLAIIGLVLLLVCMRYVREKRNKKHKLHRSDRRLDNSELSTFSDNTAYDNLDNSDNTAYYNKDNSDNTPYNYIDNSDNTAYYNKDNSDNTAYYNKDNSDNTADDYIDNSDNTAYYNKDNSDNTADDYIDNSDNTAYYNKDNSDNTAYYNKDNSDNTAYYNKDNSDNTAYNYVDNSDNTAYYNKDNSDNTADDYIDNSDNTAYYNKDNSDNTGYDNIL